MSEGPTIRRQQDWWNRWISEYRDSRIGEVSERQAAWVLARVGRIGGRCRRPLDILDVGCGSGWMCERLSAFGRVTGTDLAEEAIERARARRPDIRYIVGDFLALDLPRMSYDVLVSLEVLSHVADQPAFMARLAKLLRPGGHLLLCNQNRWVLERNRGIRPQGEDQLRKWTTRRELRALARPWFRVHTLTTLSPRGDLGLLRWINAAKVDRTLGPLLGGRPNLYRLKEKLGFGWTVALHARVRSRPVDTPPADVNSNDFSNSQE